MKNNINLGANEKTVVPLWVVRRKLIKQKILWLQD